MSTVEGDVDPAASNMFYPDFSNLTLLPYLACHPHPSFVLPSPRPSLVSLWTNPAASAASLGKDLETILSPLDQARMKSLILAHDQDLDGVISADKDHTTNQAMADAISIPSVRAPSSIESYNSFQDGNNSMDGNEMDITVRLPLWGRKRSYKVLLVSSSHPSFLILHLHPISRPNSHKPKPKANENHSSSVNPVAWEDLQQLTGDEITSRIEVGQGYSSDGNDAHTPMAEEHHKLLTESSILMDSWLAQDAQVPAPPTLVINEKSKKKLEEFDWANHPLGPRDKWPVPLVTTVNMLLSITDSSYIWWSYGDDWIIINNDAYGQDLNENHFGSFASVAWADENWMVVKQKALHCQKTRTGVSKSDDTFFLNGMEKHLTWKWTPIVSGDGECHGIMVTTHDSTGKVLNERWQQTSREIVRRLTPARTISEFCGSLMKSLEINERDFPYAFLYQLRSETASGEKTDISVEANLTLAGSVGIPLDHPVLPRSTFIKTSLDKNSENRDLTPWKFKEAIEAAFHSDEPISLPDVHVNIPEEIRYRSYGDETKQAVIMKIANNEERRGKIFFLVIGLNTRRPLDSAYKARIDDLRLQLISNLTIITSFESHMDRELQLQSIEKAKSLFFSSVSHELRTPLQLISGPISDLEAGESDPKKKASFSMIQRNSTRLARLVDSLMDFSRIEGGRMSGRFIPINFSLTTIELSEMFRSAIERARITYVVDCEVESGARPVYVDKELYEKIVFNILGNAFKYTLRGSITVRVSHHPSEVELCVTDTGVGIPKQDLPRVTERFFRVTCTARSHEGTGMGLALCSDLVHLHSGRLQIDSETEEESPTGESGTTVSVFLPYGKSHLPASQTSEEIDSSINLSSTYSKWIVDEAVRWSNSRNGTSASVSESGLSASESSGRADSLYWNKSSDLVLIVDDSSDMRQYMNQIFSSFCKVITARDGEEALALARSAKPNLILSDISMPKLDGYGLLRALRKENPDEDDIDLALIPVILISARAGDEERVSGLLAGAEDYLSKPFSAKELIARAHLQLQLGKSRLELERNFREQSAATKLLSDASPVGISRWNADGEIIYVNEAWRTQSGHPRDKDLSLWLDSVADHHKPYLQQIYNELFLEKKASSWEWQWANGTWSFCQAVIISSHTQSLVGTICVLTDVTNQKRIEEERKQNLLRAEAAKREADDKKRHQEFLVSVVSHEVRNPVSAILQCAGLCKSNLTFIRTELETALNSGKAYFPTSELINLIDEDVDALESIHQMALSQERIANDVLSLGKIQLESLEIFATDVNLPDECRKIISVFEGECRMKQIRISLDLVGELAKPDGQHIYLTDPVRFGQIAINLISNGIRFTDKASMHRREISVSIEVASAAPDDDSCRPPKTSVPVTPGSSCYIYGAVTDSGPGLTPEELTRLFQRFSQASSSTHAVYGGSGLGLYVCRMITSLMNGRINVESVKGEGSTFRFFIKADAPLSFQHPLKPVFASSVTTKVVQLHILVVEDNQINQKVLRRQLMKAGLTCECADDGKMALDLIVASHTLGNKTFDAILMDQEMPVMDGITSVTHIRKMEDDGIIPKRVPIFALTGNARKEQIERMLEVGMDDVIIKPYRINALLDKLCTLTSRQSSLHCHASSKQQQ